MWALLIENKICIISIKIPSDDIPRYNPGKVFPFIFLRFFFSFYCINKNFSKNKFPFLLEIQFYPKKVSPYSIKCSIPQERNRCGPVINNSVKPFSFLIFLHFLQLVREKRKEKSSMTRTMLSLVLLTFQELYERVFGIFAKVFSHFVISSVANKANCFGLLSRS